MVGLPDIYLQPSVAGFEYPRRGLPAGVHFIGALPPLPTPYVPERVPAARAQCKRIVLNTQGTVANKDLRQLPAPAMAALAGRDDVPVLASTGGQPLDAIPPGLPANAMVATFLPFDAVMPLVNGLLNNGGNGPVTHASAWGMAIVSGAMGEDKPEVNARIAWSGAGIHLKADKLPCRNCERWCLRCSMATLAARVRSA